MKVKATKLGFYGNRRRYEGKEFYIQKPEHFSENWMVKVEKKNSEPEMVAEKAPAKKKAPVKNKVEAEKKNEARASDKEVI